MIIRKDVDFSHTDGRGAICQVIGLPSRQVNYVFTRKGAKRGQHYHKENREFFYIIGGKAAVEAYSVKYPSEEERHVFDTGDLFVIEPYTMHSFEFLEDTQMIVVYDLGVENGDERDIYTR